MTSYCLAGHIAEDTEDAYSVWKQDWLQGQLLTPVVNWSITLEMQSLVATSSRLQGS